MPIAFVQHKAELRFRLFPEWASFADFFHGLDHLADIFVHMRNVVLIQAPPEVRSGEELKQVRQ